MALEILIYIGAILTIFWGISHLFPTKTVVKDFGEISQDNKWIITMEWVNEGLTLIFIGILNLIITAVGLQNTISILVYWISAIMLFSMAVLSLFTGARINFIPYRLCPVIFSISAILILIGSIL